MMKMEMKRKTNCFRYQVLHNTHWLRPIMYMDSRTRVSFSRTSSCREWRESVGGKGEITTLLTVGSYSSTAMCQHWDNGLVNYWALLRLSVRRKAVSESPPTSPGVQQLNIMHNRGFSLLGLIRCMPCIECIRAWYLSEQYTDYFTDMSQ